jgi:hypothetical protein
VTIVDNIELYQEVKQLAVDVSIKIDQQDLFLFISQFKSVSALTVNFRMHSDIAIVSMGHKDRYFFDTYHLIGVKIYIKP